MEECLRLHRPAETPEDEAEAAVRIQADGDFSGRVQLTLQLHRPTEGSHCIMGHLEAEGDETESANTTAQKVQKNTSTAVSASDEDQRRADLNAGQHPGG